MKKSERTDQTITPYESAYLEWSSRLGSARAQLKNWRLAALLSILVAIFLVVALIMVLNMQKTYVYVADIRPGETAVNKILLPQDISPTQAEESYFVGAFIRNVMSLPLDPVLARQHWFDAYNMASGQALSQLTALAQKNDPFSNVGLQTKSVQINSIAAVSERSIQVTFTVTTYNINGVVQNQESYNGIFTFAITSPPTNTSELLKNPFGIKITYFSINREG